MMDRRRALMGESETNPTIYGSKLTWEIGILSSSTGELLSEYPTYISSNYVQVDSEKILTYNGPEKDENDTNYYVYICYYGENHAFVSREQIYSIPNHIVTKQIPENIKYVRFSYGHETTSGVNMNPSDGSLFVCLVQDRSEVKNGIVDGAYTKGSSSATYANNRLNITSFGMGSANSLPLQFKYPLNIKTGDTLRLRIKKVSGTNTISFLDAYIGGNNVCSNQAWGTGNTPIDVTKTSTTSSNSLYLTLQLRSAVPTYNNYVVSITVYVNGTQVLPEV